MKRYMQWLYLAIMLSTILCAYYTDKHEAMIIVTVIYSPFIIYLLTLKKVRV